MDQVLGLIIHLYLVHQRCIRLSPAIKDGVDMGLEGRKFGVVANGRANRLGFDQRIGITRARVRPEECAAETGHHFPEFRESVDITVRNTPLEMRLNVLKVFGIRAIDIARDIQIEIVTRNFRIRHETGVSGDLGLAGIRVNDLVDVALAETVFVAVFDETARRVDHENRTSGTSLGFVQHNNRGRNTGAIEEIGW